MHKWWVCDHGPCTLCFLPFFALVPAVHRQGGSLDLTLPFLRLHACVMQDRECTRTISPTASCASAPAGQQAGVLCGAMTNAHLHTAAAGPAGMGGMMDGMDMMAGGTGGGVGGMEEWEMAGDGLGMGMGGLGMGMDGGTGCGMGGMDGWMVG